MDNYQSSIINYQLDRDRGLDRRPRVVIDELEVLELEFKKVLHIRIHLHRRELTRFAGKLFARLVKVVAVQVQVTKGVDELACFVAAHLGKHHRQQRVRGDVERHAEEHVGTALVKLAAELALAASTHAAHIELEQAVARRQGHLVDLGHVPRTHEVAARIRVVLEAVDQVLDLVDVPAIGSRPAAPLVTIDWPQVAVLVGPFVPNGHLVVVQVLDVRVAHQEPQQFVDDGTQVKLLGRETREALRKVEAGLAAKNGARARAGTVGTVHPIVNNVLEEVEILSHKFNLIKRERLGSRG